MLKTILILSKASKLKNIHPLEKSLLSIVPIVILGNTKNCWLLILNILVFLILHLKAKNNIKIFTKITAEIGLFACISSITLIFDYGINFVIVIILRSINAGLCLSYFSLTTPIDDALYCLSKSSYLRDICDIAKSMQRFIIILNDELIILKSSIKSRGGFDTFSLKVKSTGKMAGLLLKNTMSRWTFIKEGLQSRGYRGYTPYLQEPFKISVKRLMIIIVYLSFIVIFPYVIKI